MWLYVTFDTMLRLRTDFILICIVAGYFIIVESRSLGVKDTYKRSPDTYRKETSQIQAEIKKWLKKLLSDGKVKEHKLKALVENIVKEKSRKVSGKRNLRNGMEVHEFLHKLNNFINQNTNHNDYLEKRDICNFGFGRPSRMCKKNMFRRHLSRSGQARVNEIAKAYKNYAQHMFIERANDDRSSSTSESDKPATRQKNRFRIVNNKNKKKYEISSESEGQSIEVNSEEYDDNRPVKTKTTLKHKKDTDASAEPEQTGESDDDDSAMEKEPESDSKEEFEDDKYLYLQGIRLQKPDLRSGPKAIIKTNRRGDRLPHYLPKRFKWDDEMIQHLDSYWENIKAYDTYHRHHENNWLTG